MDIFDAYEMDSDAVDQGVWGDLWVAGKNIGRIRCRSSDHDLNPAYRKAINVAGVAFAAMKEAGKSGDELERAQSDLSCSVLADTILTDWVLYRTVKKGKDAGKEVKIPFTPAKARELLGKLPKLKAAVEATAEGWTKFRRGQVDETVKI